MMFEKWTQFGILSNANKKFKLGKSLLYITFIK